MEKSPIGHLIINFKVKLCLPAEDIPLTLNSNEVQAAVWMDRTNIISSLNRKKPENFVEGFDADLIPR